MCPDGQARRNGSRGHELNRAPTVPHRLPAGRRVMTSRLRRQTRGPSSRVVASSSTTAPGLSSVSQTANAARVRDGYIRLGTRGRARARVTHPDALICRKNVIASGRPCPPVPSLHLHGKEGVDGSSPSEGFDKIPAKGHFVLPEMARK